ncbi:MAG TPA: ribonuclease H-like domain-containing protein [Candidatus Limnocylindrales bacterium]|nr:ribonuclease H-like domain-containing protein [Candidatus Limnocylindrales bacterium]
MLTQRTLADRLAAVRSAQNAALPAPGPRRMPDDDRALRLARWFDARTDVTPDGLALVVERRIPAPPGVAERLRGLTEAAYFDTETTGLSTGAGTVIFLAGVARLEGPRICVRQYLLPDYPHEAALLRALAADLATTSRLVTYNGRGFDVPMLAARLTFHGLFREQASLPAQHDDLLPDARRLFRRPLGGARLADVEAGVLGVRRTSDCPGSEVPLRYFGYLGSGSPDILAEVLDHNFQDVVSLVLLEAELCALRAGGWREARVLDARGMALELLRAGAVDDALELVERAQAVAADPGEANALRRVAARLLIALGLVERAEALWALGTRRASVDAATAWIEVARIRERHRGDLRGAMEAVEAASRVLDIAFALGRGGSIAEVGRTRLTVERRLRRLRRWVEAAERRAARAAKRRVA